MTEQRSRKTSTKKTARKRLPGSPPEPEQMYRVEGIGRRGVIRYVKVFGRRGSWRIRGMDGLDIVVRALTVEEALRRAKRQIPFRPIVIRRVSPEELSPSVVPLPPTTSSAPKKS